jgi:Arc/MetJ family transcription regulator
MRTTVEIDDRLLEAARRATGTAEVQALVELGLQELVRQQQRQALVESFGSFDLALTDQDLARLRQAELGRLAPQ